MIVTCDPGAKAAGISLWDDNELSTAWLARGASWHETAAQACSDLRDRAPLTLIDTLVIEIPQVYTQRKQKGDPNDLITVALNAGAFSAFVAAFASVASVGSHQVEVVTYAPRQWKGQVPKNIAIKRFQKRLSIEELGRIEKCPASLRHNVMDAVGLGLYYTGRLS